MTADPEVAAAQAEAVAGDVAANVATAAGWSARPATGRPGRVLPEAFLTGYDVDVFAGRHLPALDGPPLEPLRDAARDDRRGRGRQRALAAGCDRRTLSMLVVGARRLGRRALRQAAPRRRRAAVLHAGDHGASIVVDGLELGARRSATTAASPSTPARPPPTARSPTSTPRRTSPAPSTAATLY